MRLGILSDTHDQFERVRRAVDLLRAEGVDVLLHCGDVKGPEIVSICGVLPSYFTFGNNDADAVPELRSAIASIGGTCLGWGGVFQLAGKRLAMTHGHMSIDVRRLLDTHPEYLFTGHSHIASDRLDHSTRRINPGALYEADAFTVAVLDLSSGELRILVLTQ